MPLVNKQSANPITAVFVHDGTTTATSSDFPFDLIDGDTFSLDGSTGMECERAGRYVVRVRGSALGNTGTYELQKNGTNVSTLQFLNFTGQCLIETVWADDLIVGDILTIENISGNTDPSYLIAEIEAV
jgi:hypothetical protein